MENKLARFLRNIGPARFFVPFGIIAIIVGIFFVSTSPKEYGETQAVITDVQIIRNADEKYADIEFEYTVDGKTYTSTFSHADVNSKVGDKLTIYYDPANPQNVSNMKNGGIIGIVLIIAGVAAIAGGVFFSVRAMKKSKQMDEDIKAHTGSDRVMPVQPLPKEQLTEYYVQFDGKSFKPGYTIEDKDRNLVYEMTMDKNALVSERSFTFRNHQTMVTTEHKVGHTITTGSANFMWDNRSWFKFDGKNVWDVIHEKGIRIETSLLSSFPNLVYTVSRYGTFIATIETSGKMVHEEDAAKHKINVPLGKYYYRFWTNETAIDDLALTIFAISETEQTMVE